MINIYSNDFALGITIGMILGAIICALTVMWRSR